MEVQKPAFVSFPPGQVSDGPVRLPVLWNGEAGLALEKPAGIAVFQDSRLGGGPRSIVTSVNKRVAEGAGQFERLGVEALSVINHLATDASGIVLFAKNARGRAELKNAMGSLQFSFVYQFLSDGERDEDEVTCELPVAVHRVEPKALVSRKTGKKTVTRFRRVQRFENVSLWESASPYDRFHQVRLHAAEAGIAICGDPVYSSTGEHRQRPTLPFFLHLHRLHFPGAALMAPHPAGMKKVLRTLARPPDDRRNGHISRRL